MDKKEIALEKFYNGCNCAQAVVCTYANELNLDEESAYRISEGFGSGIPGLQNLCGACSGMIMVTSLQNCEKKDIENPSRPKTYAKVREVVKEFENRMGSAECKVLLKTKDNTLIKGKRAGCAECVKCACDIIESNLRQ